MKRRFRLTRSTDIKRVRQFGKSYAHPLVVLVLAANPDPSSLRVGVIAGQRAGGAIQRNRAKRQIRAALHNLHLSLRPGWDLIFIARQPITQASFSEIQEAITCLLKRARIYETGTGSRNGSERTAGTESPA